MTGLFLLLVGILCVLALRKVFKVRKRLANSYRDETNFYRRYIHPKGQAGVDDRKQLADKIKALDPKLNRQQCLEQAARVQELMREKAESVRA